MSVSQESIHLREVNRYREIANNEEKVNESLCNFVKRISRGDVASDLDKRLYELLDEEFK